MSHTRHHNYPLPFDFIHLMHPSIDILCDGLFAAIERMQSKHISFPHQTHFFSHFIHFPCVCVCFILCLWAWAWAFFSMFCYWQKTAFSSTSNECCTAFTAITCSMEIIKSFQLSFFVEKVIQFSVISIPTLIALRNERKREKVYDWMAAKRPFEMRLSRIFPCSKRQRERYMLNIYTEYS